MMKRTPIFAALAAGLTLPAHADEPRELGVETRIPFAGSSIRDFHAEDDLGVWLKDNRSDWFYARFVGPCFGIGFRPTIGIAPRIGGSLDSLGAIVVDGRECSIASLVTSAPPPEYGESDED